MIIPADIKNKYNFFLPYFKFIHKQLDQTLMNFCHKYLYAYVSRIKEVSSICEKIETGRYSSWNEIDDFIGCAIIIPNLSYENHVIEFLDEAFIKSEIRKKGSTFKSYDVFRFDSTRFIGKLRQTDDKKSSEIFSIKFEIQIRSAFEHAWSVTTHNLAYKSPNIDWKILRLSAQLKSSVEQLDMIALSAKDVNKQITAYKWPEIDIKIQILKYLKDSFDNEKIPDELKPKDFSRVIDNIYQLVKPNLSIWKSRKWKKEVKELTTNIDLEIEKMNIDGFPLSLSLYQIIFGILAKKNLIGDNVLKNLIIYRSEAFDFIFPELKNIKLNKFNI